MWKYSKAWKEYLKACWGLYSKKPWYNGTSPLREVSCISSCEIRSLGVASLAASGSTRIRLDASFSNLWQWNSKLEESLACETGGTGVVAPALQECSSLLFSLSTLLLTTFIIVDLLCYLLIFHSFVTMQRGLSTLSSLIFESGPLQFILAVFHSSCYDASNDMLLCSENYWLLSQHLQDYLSLGAQQLGKDWHALYSDILQPERKRCAFTWVLSTGLNFRLRYGTLPLFAIFILFSGTNHKLYIRNMRSEDE